MCVRLRASEARKINTSYCNPISQSLSVHFLEMLAQKEEEIKKESTYRSPIFLKLSTLYRFFSIRTKRFLSLLSSLFISFRIHHLFSRIFFLLLLSQSERCQSPSAFLPSTLIRPTPPEAVPSKTPLSLLKVQFLPPNLPPLLTISIPLLSHKSPFLSLSLFSPLPLIPLYRIFATPLSQPIRQTQIRLETEPERCPILSLSRAPVQPAGSSQERPTLARGRGKSI